MNDNDHAGGPGRLTRRTALRRAGAGALALSGDRLGGADGDRAARSPRAAARRRRSPPATGR